MGLYSGLIEENNDPDVEKDVKNEGNIPVSDKDFDKDKTEIDTEDPDQDPVNQTPLQAKDSPVQDSEKSGNIDPKDNKPTSPEQGQIESSRSSPEASTQKGNIQPGEPEKEEFERDPIQPIEKDREQPKRTGNIDEKQTEEEELKNSIPVSEQAPDPPQHRGNIQPGSFEPQDDDEQEITPSDNQPKSAEEKRRSLRPNEENRPENPNRIPFQSKKDAKPESSPESEIDSNTSNKPDSSSKRVIDLRDAKKPSEVSHSQNISSQQSNRPVEAKNRENITPDEDRPTTEPLEDSDINVSASEKENVDTEEAISPSENKPTSPNTSQNISPSEINFDQIFSSGNIQPKEDADKKNPNRTENITAEESAPDSPNNRENIPSEDARPQEAKKEQNISEEKEDRPPNVKNQGNIPASKIEFDRVLSEENINPKEEVQPPSPTNSGNIDPDDEKETEESNFQPKRLELSPSSKYTDTNEEGETDEQRQPFQQTDFDRSPQKPKQNQYQPKEFEASPFLPRFTDTDEKGRTDEQRQPFKQTDTDQSPKKPKQNRYQPVGLEASPYLGSQYTDTNEDGFTNEQKEPYRQTDIDRSPQKPKQNQYQPRGFEASPFLSRFTDTDKKGNTNEQRQPFRQTDVDQSPQKPKINQYQPVGLEVSPYSGREYTDTDREGQTDEQEEPFRQTDIDESSRKPRRNRYQPKGFEASPFASRRFTDTDKQGRTDEQRQPFRQTDFDRSSKKPRENQYQPKGFEASPFLPRFTETDEKGNTDEQRQPFQQTDTDQSPKKPKQNRYQPVGLEASPYLDQNYTDTDGEGKTSEQRQPFKQTDVDRDPQKPKQNQYQPRGFEASPFLGDRFTDTDEEGVVNEQKEPFRQTDVDENPKKPKQNQYQPVGLEASPFASKTYTDTDKEANTNEQRQPFRQTDVDQKPESPKQNRYQPKGFEASPFASRRFTDTDEEANTDEQRQPFEQTNIDRNPEDPKQNRYQPKGFEASPFLPRFTDTDEKGQTDEQRQPFQQTDVKATTPVGKDPIPDPLNKPKQNRYQPVGLEASPFASKEYTDTDKFGETNEQRQPFKQTDPESPKQNQYQPRGFEASPFLPRFTDTDEKGRTDEQREPFRQTDVDENPRSPKQNQYQPIGLEASPFTSKTFTDTDTEGNFIENVSGVPEWEVPIKHQLEPFSGQIDPSFEGNAYDPDTGSEFVIGVEPDEGPPEELQEEPFRQIDVDSQGNPNAPNEPKPNQHQPPGFEITPFVQDVETPTRPDAETLEVTDTDEDGVFVGNKPGTRQWQVPLKYQPTPKYTENIDPLDNGGRYQLEKFVAGENFSGRGDGQLEANTERTSQTRFSGEVEDLNRTIRLDHFANRFNDGQNNMSLFDNFSSLQGNIGFSAEPFVLRKPESGGGSVALANIKQGDSRIAPIGSATEDTVRMGKFFTTGKGVVYGIKQQFFQSQNPRKRTRLYDQTAPLQTSASGMAIRPGQGITRHLSPDSGPFGIVGDAASAIGIDVPQSARYEDEIDEEATSTGWGEMTGSLFWLNPIMDNSTGSVPGLTGSAMENYVDQSQAENVSNIKPLHSTEEAQSFSEFAASAIARSGGIGKGYLFTGEYDAGRGGVNDSVEMKTDKYHPGAPFLGNPFRVGDRSTTKPEDFVEADIAPQQTPSGGQYVNLKEKVSEARDDRREKFPYANLEDGSPDQDQIGAGNQNDVTNDKYYENRAFGEGERIPIHRGVPGQEKSRGFPNYSLKNEEDKKTKRMDWINRLEPIVGKDADPEQEAYGKDGRHKDFIPFKFYDIENEGVLVFRAILEGISDNLSPEWSQQDYAGRPEQGHKYSGYSNTISFSFQAMPTSREEFKAIWKKINYLKGLTTPASYSAPSGGGGYMTPPFMRLTIGDMFNDVYGYMNSLTISVNDDAPWEIDEDLGRLPRGLEIDVDWQVIQKRAPRALQKFYDVPFIEEMEDPFKETPEERAPVDLPSSDADNSEYTERQRKGADDDRAFELSR